MLSVILIAFGLPGTLYNWVTWTHWWNQTVWPLISDALYASPRLLSPAMLFVGIGLLFTDIAQLRRLRSGRKPHKDISWTLETVTTGEPEPTPAAKRVFLEKTPEDLVNIYAETTTTRADQIIVQYIHRWMLIEGTVGDTDRCNIFCRTQANTKNALIAPVSLRFDFSWEDRLSQLQRGDSIRAIGRLISVTSIDLTLDQCELLPTAT